MIQIPPDIPQQTSVNNFPFHVGHSFNLLLIPTHETQMHRLIPTVMQVSAIGVGIAITKSQ